MSTTVYTYNDKVLVNSANDKWLKKPDAPAGFVMNASNLVSTTNGTAYWEGPAYPNAYNGEGKTIQIIVSETIGRHGTSAYPINYCSDTSNSGPQAALFQTPDFFVQPGTYTIQMGANPAYAYGYGKYLSLFAQDATLLADILSKITITIVDP